MNVLGLIPARKGSKGIPHKNIAKLNGIPLINYTITAAKNSKFINKIFVSTDDKKIAKLAEEQNIPVPYLRPKLISKDISTNLEVIKHTLKLLDGKENYKPKIIKPELTGLDLVFYSREKKYFFYVLKRALEYNLSDMDNSICRLRDLFIGLTDGGLE